MPVFLGASNAEADELKPFTTCRPLQTTKPIVDREIMPLVRMEIIGLAAQRQYTEQCLESTANRLLRRNGIGGNANRLECSSKWSRQRVDQCSVNVAKDRRDA